MSSQITCDKTDRLVQEYNTVHPFNNYVFVLALVNRQRMPLRCLSVKARLSGKNRKVTYLSKMCIFVRAPVNLTNIFNSKISAALFKKILVIIGNKFNSDDGEQERFEKHRTHFYIKYIV